VDPRWIRVLFAYGSWITVSGIISPILVSLDRTVIGVIRGAAAVTYYTVPFSFATKFLILPVSISRTLFPRFSMQDDQSAKDLARDAVVALAVVMTPLVAVALVLLRPFFQLWLGAHLAELSVPAGEILLLGVWINGLAHVPSAYLQARGRPDMTAKLHLIELVPFVALLWIGLRVGGVEGAASVWTIRVAADFVLLSAAARLGWRMSASLALPAATLMACAVALRFFPEIMLLRVALIGFALTVSVIWALVAAPPALRALAMGGRSLLFSAAKVPSQV
jgi:O-antigen/teichoic acid export membrane protein